MEADPRRLGEMVPLPPQITGQGEGRDLPIHVPELHIYFSPSFSLSVAHLVTRPSVSPNACVLGVNLLFQHHPSFVTWDSLPLSHPPDPSLSFYK